MATLPKWLKPLFGDANARLLKPLHSIVEEINAKEAHYEAMDDSTLQAQTPALKERLAQGESLDALLPDAFAVVREAAKRTLKQRHFDVQLMGGIILHRGNIAEMKTGEGKTLAATLPCYLNALTDRPVHVVTVNDYLAQRDAEWMGQIHKFLGLEVGCIVGGITDEERKAAYSADITYGTNNEFGFDYLRDNMKYRTSEMVQRGHYFAIVDEVDSILIDEARTPLIISGAADDEPHLYQQIDEVVQTLAPEHYELDEKNRNANLTEAGNEAVEEILRQRKILGAEESLYEMAQVGLVHHITNALRAHRAFTRDKDYIVKDKQVVIIDEFTGRMMAGRRFSDGLHQALEAKEHVPIEAENQTLAAVTFQNYFRLYEKLAGMTGTAATEADEFLQIYGLDVLIVPTNAPVARADENDEVYRTAEEKHQAIIAMIAECQKRDQPVLVGTTSIEKSEMLSARLKKQGVAHQVLNARYHEQEAQIIAQAGRAGAVTIATNMAGRGTDIQLGGNADMLAQGDNFDEKEIAENKQRVIAAGGLCVIGTERHESRRIDNQLRGRSGRQGDPGLSRFFLSLEDDLMRIFGTDKMDGLLKRLGLDDGEAIAHPWITAALERAQKKVEAHNFDARKNILKFDDVMNEQRKVIFEQRREIMESEDLRELVADMRSQVLEDSWTQHIPEKSYMEQWDLQGMSAQLSGLLGEAMPLQAWAQEDGTDGEGLRQRIAETFESRYNERRKKYGDSVITNLERSVLLETLDQHWREHLSALEHLRQVVGLRGYGQRDPLNEYKLEAFEMFRALLARVRNDVTGLVLRVAVQVQTAAGLPQAPAEAALESAPPAPVAVPHDPTWDKTPRNAPCPCGSGKKYKQCHGKGK